MDKNKIYIKKDLPNNVKLIGISGLAHTGKDTLANFLKEKRKEIVIESFATPIKEIMINYFGFTREQVYDQRLKEIEDKFWNITPRKLMQLIGTEMFRKNFRYDVWVKVFEKKILNNPNNFFVVADIRFNNEAEMVIRNNGIVIKILRNSDNVVNMSHESEKGIDENLVHIFLDNNGDLNDLKKNANIILNLIK